jgi:hypothetical protein
MTFHEEDVQVIDLVYPLIFYNQPFLVLNQIKWCLEKFRKKRNVIEIVSNWYVLCFFLLSRRCTRWRKKVKDDMKGKKISSCMYGGDQGWKLQMDNSEF